MSAWVVVPVEPTDKLLLSMAIRFDHGLGLPGYYDQELFGKKLGGDISHARRLEVALSQMRQLHEEVVGAGFYKAARPTGPDVPVMIDASELEMFKQCRRLLYGFMLDTNAIGLTGAAENLARGIKDHAIAQEKAG